MQPSDDVTDGGERVAHTLPDEVYYAHLSIYRFAEPYCRGKHVLDAGSGSGYGSAYLAEHGAASVLGIDISEKAVVFSKAHFQRDNLRYEVNDLGQLADANEDTFDVIFSSNVLEHIQDVDAFLGIAARLLKPDGVLIGAVPPIFNAYLFSMNIANPYHLNIWTPEQWQAVLRRHFGEISYFKHRKLDTGPVSQAGSPSYDPAKIEYAFDPSEVEQPHADDVLTSVFVVRKPIRSTELPPLTFVDQSFTRSADDRQTAITASVARQREQAYAELEQQLARQQQRVRELEETIARKDQHILALEGLLRRIEAGRVLRVLRWLSGNRS